MPYVALEACTVNINGQPRRGAKATCGHCSNVETLSFNTMRGRGDDDERIERLIAHKFERIGWKIGKHPSQNRCPKCFTAIKISAVKKGHAAMAEKQPTQVTPEVPRTMTRDERRIIFEKINEVYVGEKVGYSDGWSDDAVAKDLGVARAWVALLRDDMFGPDINEHTTKVVEEARALLEEMKAAWLAADPLAKQIQALATRADQIQQALHKIVNPKR